MGEEPRPRAKFWKPCERCSVRDADGNLTHFDKDGNELKGMKLVAKHSPHLREYQCQDCGGLMQQLKMGANEAERSEGDG